MCAASLNAMNPSNQDTNRARESSKVSITYHDTLSNTDVASCVHADTAYARGQRLHAWIAMSIPRELATIGSKKREMVFVLPSALSLCSWQSVASYM